jgi:hypothetical protein
MSDIGQADRRPILIVARVLLVPLVIIAIWAAGRAQSARIRNPGAAVVDARGRIWVLAGPSCILLDAEGSQLQEWSAAELGVEPPFAGIAALPDGGVAIGSYATGRVRFVDADGARGDEIDVRRGRRPEGSFQLWYDAASERLIVTDTPNHRVAVFDRRGVLRAESGPGDFRFPNGVTVDDRGRIVVADTNHHRIAVLDGSLRLLESLRVEGSRRFRFPVFVSAGFGGESAWLRFDIPRRGVAAALELALDDARTVQQLLAEREPQWGPSDTFYERCPSCGRRGDSCADCETKRLGPYPAALLSAIVPGLGQIVNGAFLRGTLFLALAGALGLVLITPVRELVRRSTEVPVLAVAEVALFLVAVWAVAVWDAWASADTRRWRWGIRAA